MASGSPTNPAARESTSTASAWCSSSSTTATWLRSSPFEITVSLTDEMCLLGIQDCHAESPAAPRRTCPETIATWWCAPPRAEGGQARPSASISALPHWMQAKAPIWVPTSDILPNRFRSRMLLIGLVGVLGWAAIAFAAKWNSAYSPGPTTEAHRRVRLRVVPLASFARVSDTSCQACHADQQGSARCINSRKSAARLATPNIGERSLISRAM